MNTSEYPSPDAYSVADLHAKQFESSSDDEDADDWLFRSVKMYDELHIYELSNPTPVIEWTTNNSVCIACKLSSGRTEILQLSLPSSLLPASKNICKEHDFSVMNGGFYDHHIVDVRHVPTTRVLATAEAMNNRIYLWTMPEDDSDSGIIQRNGEILNRQPTLQPAQIASFNKSTLAFGDLTDNVCIVDVSTSLITLTPAMSSDSGEALSCMFYMDESCLIGCTRNNGSITMWDLRAGSAAVQSYNNSAQQSNQTWTCHKLNRSSSLVDGLLLQTSSDGDIVLRDIRNARRDVLQTTIEQKFPKPFQDFMTVGVSNSDDSFSVSGCDSNVYVYEMPVCDTGRQLRPQFVHTGHKHEASDTGEDVVVWTSSWHPGSVSNTLVSAASDGSLHAWQYLPSLFEENLEN